MISAIILGLLVGIVSLLTGIGGGVIMVPLMPSFFSITQHEVVATSLLVVFLNSSQLVLLGKKNKAIRFRDSNYMLFPGLAFSILASISLFYFSERLLKIILFLSLLLATYLLLFPFKKEVKNKEIESVIIGALGGAISGLTGLGGGVIVGSFAYGLSLIKMNIIAPTISYITMAFSFSAIVSHYMRSYLTENEISPIRYTIAGIIFISALLTSRLLYPWQKKLPDNLRKWLLVFICALLLVKSLFNLI